MSFSTFSDAHPSIVVAAAPPPSTLRNSRRLTPLVGAAVVTFESDSWLIRSIVTDGAIVPRAERWIRLADVTVDAPAHVQRIGLVDLFHRLNLAVASLTSDAGVHVAHVGEVHVLRKLVDSNPGHRLVLAGERSELLDFCFVLVGGSLHYSVATHAGAHRG